VTDERAHVDRATGGRPTLGEETRSMAKARIVQGAATALATRGFDATVDDIAAAAGVGWRTVFRHFATHDDLVAAAVAEIVARYEQMIPGPPSPGVDVETWLREMAATMHDLNVRLIGRAFWDMNVERPGISPADRDRRRFGYAAQMARHAWGLAGGDGHPPSWVVDAFALQLSGFATNCLTDYSVEKAARVSARILMAVLTSALTDESG
jgi:AcrR family transcriptional regulator